ASFLDSKAVPVGEWVRVVVVMDATNYHRTFYINGQRSHRVYDVQGQGRWAINTVRNRKPLLCFFADNDGEDADILVKRVILYKQTLTGNEVQRLGSPDDLDLGW
ncbi:MAG TPA: hypothetical protein DCP28_10455, partial [Cytophagales bacterium]|nr:hypothetical protein [Cytophagales bacterium]